MFTATKFKGQEILRDLIPLNSLSTDKFLDIAKNLVIEDVSTGSYLFGIGDTDNRSIYLLDGEVSFVDARGRITSTVTAGTEPGRYPLANQQPRLISARVSRKAVIAYIDSTLLDVLLTFDQSSGSRPAGDNRIEDEWLTRMFRSEAFVKVPPGDIQQILRKMESVKVATGDVVIRQGEAGDYFYIVREGRCSVTRAASSAGWDVPLAELGKGDCFGEEALVSEARRNATVTMTTDGVLMRLAKQDFLELLKKPLVHYVDYQTALQMIAAQGMWLDVRLPDEYACHAFENSINIPLLNLRDKVDTLQPGKQYIICCDTGRRSASAAFILSQRGFEVYVLEGGLTRGVPGDVFGLSTGCAGSKTVGDERTAKAASVANEPPLPATAQIHAPNTALEDMRQERDAARREYREIQRCLAGLQEGLVALRSEISRYREKARHAENACREERLARAALLACLEKLESQPPD
ncbi:MAG: cyclic nucleotide-binding domain-containing protein [Gammaproteobacteria bacterium]|jgi:CRP-like cAMP-binding protein